jgi:hypothetical protein
MPSWYGNPPHPPEAFSMLQPLPVGARRAEIELDFNFFTVPISPLGRGQRGAEALLGSRESKNSKPLLK